MHSLSYIIFILLKYYEAFSEGDFQETQGLDLSNHDAARYDHCTRSVQATDISLPIPGLFIFIYLQHAFPDFPSPKDYQCGLQHDNSN